MKVVPSVLAEDRDDFVLRMRQAEEFTDYVQIDVMDGVFVDTASISPELINTLATSLAFEMHLMVIEPADVVRKIHHPGLRKIIFHFESRVDHQGLANEIKRRGLSAGLAVGPETTLETIGKTAWHFDTLLFLTVSPGRYGSAFLPETVPKVSEARKTFPQKTIGVDGGVSTDNLGMFYDIGVDYACVGSRIFMGERPKENYGRLMKRLNELQHSQ
jgi:ribulose-phosphate 3-epimerase